MDATAELSLQSVIFDDTNANVQVRVLSAFAHAAVLLSTDDGPEIIMLCE